MSDKKKMQLGMNPSTASHRLVKDVLWKLIQQPNQDHCCKCGELMSREAFSIEHVIPWLDSENPVDLYFNLDNIAFSHLSCNVSDSRKPHKKYENFEGRHPSKKINDSNRTYSKDKRREQYLRTGK